VTAKLVDDGIPTSSCSKHTPVTGRRVIINRLTGQKGAAVDVAAVDELTFLSNYWPDREQITCLVMGSPSACVFAD
jgi:hypothetical protein